MTDQAYTVTTYRTRFEGVSGFGGRDVRSGEETVTVTGRAALVRELDANGVRPADTHTESGLVEFQGYVTEWAPVAPAVGDTGPDGTAVVMVCSDGYLITQAMVDAEIADQAAPRTTAGGQPAAMWIVGINASSNMFA